MQVVEASRFPCAFHQIVDGEPGQPALSLRYKQPGQAIPSGKVSANCSEFVALNWMHS